MTADSALVDIRADRLDAVFPADSIPPDGCRGYASTHARSLHWNVTYEQPPVTRALSALAARNAVRPSTQLDSLGQLTNTPSIQVSVPLEIEFPRATPLTPHILDSAFARRALWVETATVFHDGGDRPLVTQSLVEAERRAIYFDRGHLHLVMQGRAAVEAFLKHGPDTVTLRWCAHDGRDTVLFVSLRRS